MSDNVQKPDNKKMVIRLLGVVAGMFVFGFALVPLYDVFCEVTGINGKTRGQAIYQKTDINKDRQVKITFITNINRGMPWDFKPLVNSMKVHPGEMNEVRFYAKNRSQKAIIGQSIPSVSPGQANLYLNKTECFCFDQQTLAAGEEIEMPMKFYIDADIPDNISHLTLSYQLYNVTDAVQNPVSAAK